MTKDSTEIPSSTYSESWLLLTSEIWISDIDYWAMKTAHFLNIVLQLLAFRYITNLQQY